MEGPLNTAYFE